MKYGCPYIPSVRKAPGSTRRDLILNWASSTERASVRAIYDEQPEISLRELR